MLTTWHLPAPREQVWSVLADPAMSWPRWWPHLTAHDVRPGPDGGVVGTRAALELRPARWAYALRFDVEVTAARPGERARLSVEGDLTGVGIITLVGADAVPWGADPTADPGAADPGSTDPATAVLVDWRVATTRAWMNATGPLLAPAFTAAHARAMRAGERGLTAYLAR